jgi:hypothetical protein
MVKIICNLIKLLIQPLIFSPLVTKGTKCWKIPLCEDWVHRPHMWGSTLWCMGVGLGAGWGWSGQGRVRWPRQSQVTGGCSLAMYDQEE